MAAPTPFSFKLSERYSGSLSQPQQGTRSVTTLVKEIEHAFRSLGRRPVFLLSACLTLALGIAGTTIVFSVVDAVVLRPLPFDHADRMVVLRPNNFFANREIDYLRSNATSFDEVAALSPGWLVSLTGVADPEQLNAARAAGNLFSMLGVTPALGTTFGMDAEVPGQDAVAVLSWNLWVNRFGADAAMIGRSITLDGREFQVVGVMPRQFDVLEMQADLWIPLTMARQEMTWAGASTAGLARLQPQTSMETAAAELDVLFTRMIDEFELAPNFADVRTIASLRETLLGGVRTTMLIVLCAVGFVLCITAANVANLLLVRASERGREFAVRYSLGASRWRVARSVLIESLVIGAIGGAAGLALAFPGIRAIVNLLPASTPRIAEIGVDARVLGAALLITFFTSLVFGAAPAWKAGNHSPAGRLRSGRTMTERQGRGVLIAAEVAVAVILAVGAGLMARTLVALHRVDPGFQAEGLLTMRVQPSGRSADELRAYWRELLENVRAMPGVSAAGSILHLPFSGRTWNANVEVEGRPTVPDQPLPRTAWQVISAGYLEAARIPMMSGRDFTPEDHAGAPRVVLINEAFAASNFPGENPMGRRIRAGNGTQNEWATVVGVIGSVRKDSLNTSPTPELYAPFEQRIVVGNSLIVRTRGNPADMAARIRSRIREIGSDVPVSQIRTMDDLLTGSIARERVTLALLGSFAIIGIVLGAIGIYGVVAWNARQRAREIAIRIALGARTTGLVAGVARRSITAALAGAAIGMFTALLLVRLMRGLIFGVTPTDPMTFLAAPAIMLLVAAVASVLPSWRATRMPPASALTDGGT